MTPIVCTKSVGNFLIFAFCFLFLAAFSDIASAQLIATPSTTGTPGSDAWTAVKSIWFGPAGLVFGALVFVIAVYYFFKEGVLATLGVLLVGTFFFFIPALVVSVQIWAKDF